MPGSTYIHRLNIVWYIVYIIYGTTFNTVLLAEHRISFTLLCSMWVNCITVLLIPIVVKLLFTEINKLYIVQHLSYVKASWNYHRHKSLSELLFRFSNPYFKIVLAIIVALWRVRIGIDVARDYILIQICLRFFGNLFYMNRIPIP